MQADSTYLPTLHLSDSLITTFAYLHVYTVMEKYFYKRPAFWPMHFLRVCGFSMCDVFEDFSCCGTKAAMSHAAAVK